MSMQLHLKHAKKIYSGESFKKPNRHCIIKKEWIFELFEMFLLKQNKTLAHELHLNDV